MGFGTAGQRWRRIISFIHEGNKTVEIEIACRHRRELPGVPSRLPRNGIEYVWRHGWKTGLILSPTLPKPDFIAPVFSRSCECQKWSSLGPDFFRALNGNFVPWAKVFQNSVYEFISVSWHNLIFHKLHMIEAPKLSISRCWKLKIKLSGWIIYEIQIFDDNLCLNPEIYK